MPALRAHRHLERQLADRGALERIWDWLDTAQPDVLCLQETKLTDAAFPALDFHGRGYASVHHGQGRWNGVAILSRVGLDDPVSGFGDGGAARRRGPPRDGHLRRRAGVVGVRAQRPRGRARAVPLQAPLAGPPAGPRRGRRQAAMARRAGIAVCGDFNVAPDDIDVWNPTPSDGATHVTPEERAALGELEAFGLRDAFREQYPGRAQPVQLVGLPGRRLPQAPGHAHRPDAAVVRARRPGDLGVHRPQRPQGAQAERPRTSVRGCGLDLEHASQLVQSISEGVPDPLTREPELVVQLP